MTVVRNDVDSTRIIGVAFAGAFFVAAFILFVQAWFYSMQKADTAAKTTKPASLQKYEEREAERLENIEAAKKAVITKMNR